MSRTSSVVYPDGTGEIQTISTAGGGQSLTTTATRLALPDNVDLLELIARNLGGGAVVVKYQLNPYLVVLKTTDNLATITDFSQEAQDGLAATDVTLSSLNTLANGDFLLVGSHLPFGGVYCDVDSTNGNASVLTVEYWDGSTWADITATDNTAAGGATFAQDGTITWTVPAAWAKTSLADIASPVPGFGVAYRNESLYWTRWKVSAALDASCTLNAMLALNRSTAYAEMIAAFARQLRVFKGVGGIGNLEMLTDAGTANLIINASTRMEPLGLGL